MYIIGIAISIVPVPRVISILSRSAIDFVISVGNCQRNCSERCITDIYLLFMKLNEIYCKLQTLTSKLTHHTNLSMALHSF